MRTTAAVLLAGASAALALTVPSKRTVDHQDINDTDILNFALTLEHIENRFYLQGLQNFSQQDFDTAGLPSGTRGFYQQILQHEQTHVDNLTSILGGSAVQECTYNYPVNGNVSNFVALSDLFEEVGTAAYAGASQYIANRQALLMAASILATEARQSAWINNGVRGVNPWSTPYETPLDLNQAFTVASAVIVSCPSNNTQIPVTAFPPLNVTPAMPVPGQNMSLLFTPGNTTSNSSSSGNSSSLFAAFLQGITPTFIPLNGTVNGSAPINVTVPPSLQGFAFVAITNSSSEHGDNVTVAGPAFLDIPFDSNGSLTNNQH
ncbi:hypothetical protein EWM64_g2609 [Hericium alpestre]|uniref:Uncharacterized protein n=1 Tax=Hericium alpestre TaxID=135208 RepID=A0A4Z0A4Z3_9AGAM|nr:hypothetical protein EWM64_g2609 [Hericium alpestre]